MTGKLKDRRQEKIGQIRTIVMVPLVGFELTTYSLQGGCSTNLAKAALVNSPDPVSLPLRS